MHPHHKDAASRPSALTAFVLVVCLAINVGFIVRDQKFVEKVGSLTEWKRLPYPGELPIDLDPVAFLAVNHESYRIHMDDQWKSMFPKGYPLEPITDPSILPQRALVKVPALYNQLWCLNRLREIFMSPGWENDTCKDKQVHRCLNLVRQSMMCAGDSTLEPALDLTNEEGEPERSATGIDILHVCRDWTQIRNVTEQRFLTGHH